MIDPRGGNGIGGVNVRNRAACCNHPENGDNDSGRSCRMNLILINLFLAIIWLALAAFMFVLSRTGNPHMVFGIPFEGIALVFGIYNLVRWWSMRVAASQRQQEEQPRKPSLRRPGDERIVPDPNFAFDDPPPHPTPPSGNESITPRPK